MKRWLRILICIAALAVFTGPPAARAQTTLLESVLNESDDRSVKVALQLSGSAERTSFTLSDPARLVIDFKNIDSPLVAYEKEIDDEILKGIRVGRPAPDTIRVVLDLAFLMPYEISPHGGGPSLLVRLPRRVDTRRQRTEVLPGNFYTVSLEMTNDGPVSYHVLDINLNDPQVRIEIGIGEDRVGGRETLSSIVGRNGAALGINGGYFIMESGAPIDMLIVRGKVLMLPDRFRGFFGIDSAGQPVFMRPNTELSVRADKNRPRYVERLNWPPKDGELAVFTPEFGPTTGTGPGRREVIVRDGKIVKFAGCDSAIPQNGFVLSSDDSHKSYIDSLKVGQALQPLISSYPDIRNIRYGLSAGPMLVRGGEIQDKMIEDFTVSSGIVAGRNPRTAVGRTNNNHLLFVVVEGRGTRSIGMTLAELGRLMKSLGAVDAMNLDGGGSSELVIGDKIMNMIPGGEERPLANAILIYYRKK